MNLKKLPLANLVQHPARTVLLMLMVALLAFTVFGGTMLVSSLRSGLSSLEARLGADLIVVPKTAASTTDLEKMVVEGTPGYFYMPDSVVEKIAERSGVEQISAQYYLVTAKAGCCSFPVQIIGIDPETDFTIQPWIARSYSRDLGLCDVIAGCNVSGAPGDQIRFFGIDCTIVGKLDETGTSLDNAVYVTGETAKVLIQGSVDQGISLLADYNPDEVVSVVQVKVAPGVNPTNVKDDINLHVRGVKAERARAVTSGVADGVAGVSRVIGVVVGILWVLAVVVLVVAFSIQGKQRAREFAVLRVVGASRKALSGIVLKESLIISLVGAVVGIALAAIVVFAFNGALEQALGLPFLMPGVGKVLLFALLAFVVTMIVGPATSAVSAKRLSKVDAGQVLREE